MNKNFKEEEDENSEDLPKYNVPCKYYLTGSCKLAEKCRFIHVKVKKI
jgi:hypothetical protein